jgi:magnesium-transporting ATPase (P-type)
MITGDNLLTAKCIAREVGILTDGTALEGPTFRQMEPKQQRNALESMQVRPEFGVMEGLQAGAESLELVV